MPARALELHPEAIEDIEHAGEWYATRDESAARAFLAEVDHALTEISDRPEAWPGFVHGTRRFLLRRFPFSVVYRITTSTLQVVAVAHSKRHPGFWAER